MGLFSKLPKFLNQETAKKLEEVGGDLLNGILNAKAEAEKNKSTAPAVRNEAPRAVSGDSWGGEVPREECQYNFPGRRYEDYFQKVFTEEFPGYELSQEKINGGRSTVFTFTEGGEKRLVVELMTEKSTANKFRGKCLSEGLPYVRFYYDHYGWWNTRSYVTRRVREALGL